MIRNGIYRFPVQWKKDKNDRTRFSRQYVMLSKSMPSIQKINWEIDFENKIPITRELINSKKFSDGVVALYWSETGIEDMKMVRHIPVSVSTGKNLKKKNATTLLTQAISEAQSKWNKNFKKGGYVVDKSQISGECRKVISPMALHELPTQDATKPFNLSNTKLWKEGDHVFVGRKIDGNRMMATLDDNGDVFIYGRSGAIPRNPLTHIRKQLKTLFEANGSIVPILDGEIYKHGMAHQLINGLYMNETADSSELNFIVFDIIVLNEARSKDTLGTYDKRQEYLRSYIENASRGDIPNIYINAEEEASTSAEIEKIYTQYLKDGYEGAVVRHADGLYEIGTTCERRSRRALKLKPVFDSEFEIVGYEEGKGRDKGVIIWILKMTNGKTFKARPADTIEARRELYEKMATEFESNYLGKMMTVIYTDTTKDGTPRFPRAKGVRTVL